MDDRARGGSPRAVAQYLSALRVVLVAAVGTRQEWVRRIGTLMEDARKGTKALVATSAGGIGRDFGVRFREARAELGRLTPTPSCVECHRSVASWIDQMIAASEVLELVGRTGDVKELRGAQERFAESRYHARAFNASYVAALSSLRQDVAAAGIVARRNAAVRRRVARRRVMPVR